MSVETAVISVDHGLLEPVHKAQLPRNDIDSISSIRSSPYHEDAHRLQLSTVSQPLRVVSLALQSFEPLTQEYAFEAYEKSFNIGQVVQLTRRYSQQTSYSFPETTLYVIAFRSTLHPEVQASSEKRSFLGHIDKLSHQEANESGGLIKYWFGIPDDHTGQNLATCWWDNRSSARAGGTGKTHREGVAAVKGWYKFWQVEEYELVIHAEAASYSFTRTH